MQLTDYHAKYFAYQLTKRCSSDSVEKLASVLADAQVDLNPHQVEAALSLFFVDRVANYRDYDAAGQPVKGKFAKAFEVELAALAKDERFRELEWLKQPMDKLHNGYFAQDKKGVLKDTRGDTQADDEVYNLIMKEKERLLSPDEPLRFIFSHSALREGWDNPNVFQICTLNETRSAVKKRQEIGRGLRLPVDQNGLRVFDESVNKLYVMANESYEDFARALQTEYEEECGVTFGKVPLTALAKIIRVVDGEERPIGHEAAVTIRDVLVNQKLLDIEGRIQPAFDPKRKDFKLELPEAHRELAPAVIDLLAAYQIERHIRRERDDGPNKLKKEVTLSPEFQALWDHIKPKTTYRQTDRAKEGTVIAQDPDEGELVPVGSEVTIRVAQKLPPRPTPTLTPSSTPTPTTSPSPSVTPTGVPLPTVTPPG